MVFILETGSRRITKQRKIILEELRKLQTHPTADELYEKVRSRLPRISLGTVYRNLEYMASCGMIKKLNIDERQKRFDGETVNHYHIICLDCGSVDDLFIDFSINPDELLKEKTPYRVDGYELVFSGLCPKCKSK